MMPERVEFTAGVSYLSSFSGFAVGGWLSANWLQVLSAIFVVVTYFTHLHFARKRDLREKEMHDKTVDKLEDISKE